VLEARGWKCVRAPLRGDQPGRTTLQVYFETFKDGTRFSEGGDTLEEALERAFWQQSRLDQLDNDAQEAK
jgi:hypothetical protein